MRRCGQAGRYYAYLWDRVCAVKMCVQVHTFFRKLHASKLPKTDVQDLSV